MKLFDKLFSNFEVSTYGEHPGEIGSHNLEERLHWESSCKNALMESQVRLSHRVRDLEQALQGVLALVTTEQDRPDVQAAKKVLQDRTWTKEDPHYKVQK